MSRDFPACLAAVLALATSSPAIADTVLSGDHSVTGGLCVGPGCRSAESYPTSTIKLRGDNLRLKFEDISSTASFPKDDWNIVANDSTNGGDNYLAIEDSYSNTQPFKVRNSAPSHSLVVGPNNGFIGMGTAYPLTQLHIIDGATPILRLEKDATSGNAQIWDISAGDSAFVIRDASHNMTPFSIATGVPLSAFRIDSAGDVGMGTYAPAAPLHVHRTDGKSKLRISEGAANTAPRTLLELVNNGRPEIVFGNAITGGEWSFGGGTNFVLKQGALGSSSSAKSKLFEVKPNGDATLSGSLTTGGTTCGGGCDLVFSDGYALPSIAEHAAAMYALGHLPNVGPTPENTPINVSDKLGRMLNELEHAHIYIARLEDEKTALAARLDTQADAAARQNRRIAQLEAQMARLLDPALSRAD